MIKTKEWLIESRQKAGLTQQQLADRSGVSVAAIRNIEQGTREGTDGTWESIIKGLGFEMYSFKDLINTLHNSTFGYCTGSSIFLRGLTVDDVVFYEKSNHISIRKVIDLFYMDITIDNSVLFIKEYNIDSCNKYYAISGDYALITLES